MSEERRHSILVMLNSHRDVDPMVMVRLLLDEIDEQQSQIEALGERLYNVNITIANQDLRHSNQVADLRKQIERLSGVHGA